MTEDKIWESVEAVHKHGKKAVNKRVRDLVKNETLFKYYAKKNNKGWVGNSIESDWFGVCNNSRKEADIPYLNLDIKVTPIRLTKNGWSAKERLTLNIFDFNDEHSRKFEEASFFKKSTFIELLYYEYIKNVDSPDFVIKASNLLNLKDLPKEDMLIIEQDWNTIVQKIKEGKAEELSDRLTKYLGATTKGAKTEKNLTTQPFSEIQAHRRAFTLKGAYMSTLAKKYMSSSKAPEKVIKNINELKVHSFEDIILKKYQPYIGQTKQDLASLFNVTIPKTNDKNSSAKLARKMLNINGKIENTEEFKKSGIAVKVLTIDSHNKKATENIKIIIPGQSSIEPEEIIIQEWEDSSLRDYLSSYKFLLVIFEQKNNHTVFKGAKFWSISENELDSTVKNTWEKTQSIISNGVELRYSRQDTATKSGKLYRVYNNLPGIKSTDIIHVRSSAKLSSYHDDPTNTMRLPFKSHWINRPLKTDWELSRKPITLPENELQDYYMTKQSWWFNSEYMYEQVKEFF